MLNINFASVRESKKRRRKKRDKSGMTDTGPRRALKRCRSVIGVYSVKIITSVLREGVFQILFVIGRKGDFHSIS